MLKSHQKIFTECQNLTLKTQNFKTTETFLESAGQARAPQKISGLIS